MRCKMFSEKSGDRQTFSNKHYLIASLILLVFLISGCAQPAESCTEQPRADLSGALAYAEDDQLAFQFPLDEIDRDTDPPAAGFCSGGGSGSKRMYHAAEDYHLPAGSPVYAFADGEISFSGRMGGYGWLIIIDHPQANIYSLYGHLSPSRWMLKSGTVEKGDLIGYLGDSDENGGSAKNPLVTHLHFGIRAGQRRDYTGYGEWRWMAGWIKPCPSDVGWLTPSAIITGQEIPPGGFPEPKANLFEMWGSEIILMSIYAGSGVLVLIRSLKKKNTLLPITFGIMVILAGYYFSMKGTIIQYVLYPMAVIGIGVAIYKVFLARKAEPDEDEAEDEESKS
jgi:murein DD-endopeptidase MepM/ murein hydrolase activator NlpD